MNDEKYFLRAIDNSIKGWIESLLAQSPRGSSLIGHLRSVWKDAGTPNVAISEDSKSFVFLLPEVLRSEGGLQYLFCSGTELFLLHLSGLFGPSSEVSILPLSETSKVGEECRKAVRSALLVFGRFGDGGDELAEVVVRS